MLKIASGILYASLAFGLAGCGSSASLLPPVNESAALRIGSADAGLTQRGLGVGTSGGAETLKPAANGVAPLVIASAEPQLDDASDSIVSFKTAAVTLYRESNGFAGQRLPSSSFRLPVRTLSKASNGKRVKIMTLYGPRWISTSEIKLAP